MEYDGMTVRRSEYEDIPRLMEIYRQARETMISCGNLHQWAFGYPTEDMIRNDIKGGNGYAVLDDGIIVGAFAFITGMDPTYSVIYDGEWLDDELPYGTIHRLAGSHGSHNVASVCFDWCWDRIHNLRVDTHRDNVIMKHCIEKAGFVRCGVIHLLNGDLRTAYQKIWLPVLSAQRKSLNLECFVRGPECIPPATTIDNHRE